MAIFREDIAVIDLECGNVFRSFHNSTIGEGDINGNRFGFRCVRNGEQVSLTGSTVIGHFIRADGTTVEISGGAAAGDTAYVTLPEACYAVEGDFTLAIKLSGGGVTGTIRIVDGTDVNTTNRTIIDPGTVIPDLADYMEAIEDAEAAVDRIEGFTITAELIENDDYEIIVTTGGE